MMMAMEEGVEKGSVNSIDKSTVCYEVGGVCALVRMMLSGLTGKQCTSTAADTAATAGINLDPFVSMTFPSVMDIGGYTLRLWSDPSYASVRFALPDKMGVEIKRWSGSKQKICN